PLLRNSRPTRSHPCGVSAVRQGSRIRVPAVRTTEGSNLTRLRHQGHRIPHGSGRHLQRLPGRRFQILHAVNPPAPFHSPRCLSPYDPPTRNQPTPLALTVPELPDHRPDAISGHTLPRGALRVWPHSRRRAVTGRSQLLAMGYAFHVVLKGSPYHLCTEGFSRLLCHDWCALTAQSA